MSGQRTTCTYKIELDVTRRPANALCVEIGTPLPRCTLKLPSHWTGTEASALRWLASGGSPLVLGPCSASCPRTCEEESYAARSEQNYPRALVRGEH